MQVLDREERQLNERIRTLGEAVDQKVFIIEKTNAKLDSTLREGDQVKQVVATLDYQIQELTRVNAASIDLQKRLFR
jgi:16S rRNA U516 pseudouridylate synthase RsuA-like enzyme